MSELAIHGAALLLMFVVLPVWILAGFADYWCHRASKIEEKSGTPESLLHLLQFGSVALPILLALLAEINALFFIVAAACIVIHHGMAFVDVRYANRTRAVSPFEQMVHSFLEIMPITAFFLLGVLHWRELTALLGAYPGTFTLCMKEQPLPRWYVLAAIGAAFCFGLVPKRCCNAARFHKN